jgi:signal transduction histidine kinase
MIRLKRMTTIALLATSVFFIAGTILAFRNTSVIKGNYTEISQTDSRQLIALRQTEAAMSEIIREGLSLSLMADEAASSGGADSGLIEGEGEELEEAIETFEKALATYSATRDAEGIVEEANLAEQINQAGQQLIGITTTLIEKKKAGVEGDEILTLVEVLEAAEGVFADVLDEALADGQADLQVGMARANRSVGVANWINGIFGAASLVLIAEMGFILGGDAKREQEHQQALARQNQALSEANAELVIARHQAEEANRVKSQFLASMSHELRTPMNAILSLTKFMRQGVFGPINDEQFDYLNKVIDSGDHLLSLINDVLDVTKIQSGNLKLFVEEGFDVEREIETIAATVEKMLEDKPVKLNVEIESNLPLLTCDKRRMRQIFYNLISNAIKFTDEGSITIKARRNGNELLFAVVDTGPGIALEDQDIIFDPFVQTETGIKHAGGTGLGLPISKQLAKAHNGRLWVESKPGEGSSFFLAVPWRSDKTETLVRLTRKVVAS